MVETRIRCGITMGDPSGIGAEVILKALRNRAVLSLADFIVIGDYWVFNREQRNTCLPAGRENREQRFRFVDLKNVPRKNFSFGKLRPEYGKASIEYLDKAIELLKAGKIDCLASAPVNKKAINLAGYDFSGQTEYIAKAFGVKDAVMLLCNQRLKVSLVTRHIPIEKVAHGLTITKIYKTIFNTGSGLKTLFCISHPKIAVCGLNPHASDNGVIGDEEKRLIIPAIEMARGKGIEAEGPYPADTIFKKALDGHYDCVVCMYHDQGLIPLKLTGFARTVNITLGLPFVRTSPGHGTAFDIAGKNIASPYSLIQAIKTAIQCAYNLKKA